MLDYTNAALLGILEGLTEFIPVSSTGHLILFGKVLGAEGDEAKLFEIVIQFGAILAVVLLYWRRFKDLVLPSEPRPFTGVDGIKKLIVASIPALGVGFVLHDFIDEYLMDAPVTVAPALIVGALLMLWIESRRKVHSVERIEEIPLMTCFWVGCFQCLALWPGMSRSGSTIIGAMLLGVSRTAAAELSFLMAVPIMSAAVAFSLLKKWKVLLAGDMGVFAVGFIVSFVVAVLAIKFFISMLGKYTLRPFAWYRLALGVTVLALALIG